MQGHSYFACTTKVYLFSKKEEWNLLKREKKCEKKKLIWHMVGEVFKRQGRTRLYISCNYSCTSYFLVKILLVKLKNLHISACLKLNYCTTKQRLQRWWNLSKLVTNTFVNFGIFFNSIIFSPLSSQEKISSENTVWEEWAIPCCLEDNDKNLR